MSIVYAVIFVGIMVTIFIVGYSLNSKVDKPADCTEPVSHCAACQITYCSHRREE